ncbi:MAG: phosphopantothenoylcysteine decarboxylase [Candidatus Omnitrophica bacterium]|nr:phosphopantothenoylcysteine decarboxylase [Candidatus Omnitrophota bacterium]
MRILITAGPTKEYIDPVRFISNSSTGFFGYQIASEAARRGHKVTLVSGPTCLTPPKGVKFVPVVSALEMKKAVEKHFPASDCLIMSAAVADYRPAAVFPRKIKKGKDRLVLRLKRNPDILSLVSQKKEGRVVIGFAVETADLKKNAKKKLKEKSLDYIIAAPLNNKRSPFGNRKVPVSIISGTGKAEALFSHKKNLSRIILDKAEAAKYHYNTGKIQKRKGDIHHD